MNKGELIEFIAKKLRRVEIIGQRNRCVLAVVEWKVLVEFRGSHTELREAVENGLCSVTRTVFVRRRLFQLCHYLLGNTDPMLVENNTEG